MLMRLSVLFASSLFLSASPVLADGHKGHNHASQKAHEHGVADMTISIMGNQAMIEIGSPAYNLVGFGHQPKNEEQTKMIADRMREIRSGTLIQFNDDAKCRISGQVYNNPFIEEAKAHDHDHDHDHSHDGQKQDAKKGKKTKKSNHKDFDFSYEYRCDYPSKVYQVDTHNLFDAWPNLKKVRVQWLKDQQQSSAELTSKSQQVILK